MNVIDVHSHFLPGIDDGAPTLETSLDMARIAVSQGVTHCVCTPHIQPGTFDNTVEDIQAAYTEFRQGLDKAGIRLATAFAAECHFGIEIMSGVKEGVLPFLGEWEGKKVLLLEFPHGRIPYGADQLTRWLIEQKIIPMIAHPERNRGLIASPEKLKIFLSQGCLLQVTSSSFIGRFGRSAQLLAEELAIQNVITVIGSDAHNSESRPPLFLETAERLGELAGDDLAEKWLSGNPRRLTEVLFEHSP
jgi:protein-tyrosine phosphatase